MSDSRRSPTHPREYSPDLRLTFLGTGNAGGVPLYGCDCSACTQARTVVDFRRRPCTALVEAGKTRVLLDAGLSDLTERFPPGCLSAIILTHFHPDHVQGLFHLRWGLGNRIPVYGPPDLEGCADLYKIPGLLEFRTVREFAPFHLGSMVITPVPLRHSKITFGYCIECGTGRIAYLTDTAGLPPETEALLSAWQPTILVIDCSYPPQTDSPQSHNDLTLALAVIAAVRPQRAWLTHIGHELDAWLKDAGHTLPPRVFIARDGERISVPSDCPLGP